MNKAKILFIVEGKVAEKRLCKHISQSFSLSSRSFSVCGNIHMLYQKIKALDFNINIVDFVASLPEISKEDKETIEREKPFAFVYLIFDYDPQHYDLAKKENVERGLSDIGEMIGYFNDETDPTIGKLYVNYPMFESFRDCSLSDPSSLQERTVRLKDCSKYKMVVGERGFQANVSKLSKEDINKLISMNVCKANYISTKKYSEPSYSEYQHVASQESVYSAERTAIIENGYVSVLHSSLFIVVDYFGKKFFEGAF